MTPTPAQRRLIAAARAAQCRVVNTPTHIDVLTAHGQDGIRLYEAGGAIRLGIDLAVAKNIRTIKEMRRVLGLPPVKQQER